MIKRLLFPLATLALAALVLLVPSPVEAETASRSGRANPIPTDYAQLFTVSQTDATSMVIPSHALRASKHISVLVTPGSAVTTPSSISSGLLNGQVLEIAVTGTNALLIDDGLSNVDFGLTGDAVISEGQSLRLFWDGTDWRQGSSPLSASIETVTATNTIASAECGNTFFLSAAAGFATTLPVPTVGCKLRFVVKTAPSSGAYTIATNADANVLIGGVNELEVDTSSDGPYSAAGDIITFVQSVAVVGDYVELVSDGTSFYLSGQTNADGGVTIGST